jgi:lysophospholipase L1-like esterase
MYVALGDSVTYGIGAPHPSSQGFPALVARRLRGEPIADLAVAGVPGATAAGFLDRWLDDVIETIGSAPDVGLVTIGLGANEVLQSRRTHACRTDRASIECRSLVAESIKGAAAALDTVVVRLQEALAIEGSDARMLLLAYYNPDPDPLAAKVMAGSDGVVACDSSEARPGLDDRIACVALRRGVELVDLYAAFLGRERQLTHIAEGDVHPTARGYRVIADEIVETYRAGLS